LRLTAITANEKSRFRPDLA